ncbi:hypothetical protein A7985_07080 [Pseudoalteromonas luteoviolacea]|uniref:Uncharacterized protein n=1 Tax=Pseudoalteromonas luteoviolacea TaxID=43657 RepID=A0A1C0TWJ5_9GAMM|nr:hypothetical protein A7985_07080 [Pseudoalteromonas luteoviolacea]
MKDNFEDIKNEFKAKSLYWKNVRSKKMKAVLILLFLSLIGLKVFTTVLTFDWLSALMKSI